MTDWYLSASGSDSNSGLTSLLPWLTFSHAQSTVVAGDNVHVLPGTFTTSGITINCIGTAAQPITWTDDGSASVFIVGTGGTSILVSGNYNIFKGIDVTGGATVTTFGISVSGNYNTFDTCIIHDIVHDGGSYIAGIYLQNDRYNNCVKACDIYNIGAFSSTSYVAGVLSWSYNVEISNCCIFNIYASYASDKGWGIFSLYYSYSGYMHICNNTIVAACDGINVGAQGGSTFFDNCLITNNIVANCYNYGIKGPPYPGYYCGNNIVVSNNCFFNCVTGDMYGLPRTFQATNIHADPQLNCSLTTVAFTATSVPAPGRAHPLLAQAFALHYYTNVVGTVLSLSPNSPCIDAGTNNTSGFPVDRVGMPRACGGVDIGAYEYQKPVQRPVITVHNPSFGYSQFVNDNTYYNVVLNVGTGDLLPAVPVADLVYLQVQNAAEAGQFIPWSTQLSITDVDGTPLAHAYSHILVTVFAQYMDQAYVLDPQMGPMWTTQVGYTGYTKYMRFTLDDGIVVNAPGVYTISYPVVTGNYNQISYDTWPAAIAQFNNDPHSQAIYNEQWCFFDTAGNQTVIQVVNVL